MSAVDSSIRTIKPYFKALPNPSDPGLGWAGVVKDVDDEGNKVIRPRMRGGRVFPTRLIRWCSDCQTHRVEIEISNALGLAKDYWLLACKCNIPKEAGSLLAWS